MRRIVVVLVAVTVLAAACSSSKKAAKSTVQTTTTVATPAGLTVVTVSPSNQQRIDGFGASGAWWPNDLIKFPADVQANVGRMLFAPDGIALSGYRYNIGGGGKGVINPARAPKEFPDDVAGRTFLRMAVDAHVPLITGFVNSAPPQFTTNNKACGGSLKPGTETAFAQYLSNLARTLHDDDHVTMNYVSPMNEPDDSFSDCGQEGMQVPVNQRAAIVQALGTALAKDAPYGKVIADETTADAILSTEAPQWLSSDTTRYMAAIAHHTYDFPNDALRRLLPPISKRFGLPTWMTEICCYKGSGGVSSSFGAQYDPTMTLGFWLADQIYDDLTIAGDTAWYWWTALSPVLGCDPKADARCPLERNTKGFNDGLLYYDEHYATDGNTAIYPTRRYYVLGQFSRYVRPGAVRHDVSGVPKNMRMMAFADGDRWTLVTWNEGTAPASVGVTLPNAAHAPVPDQAVYTNNDGVLASTALPARTASAAWLIQIPAQTIVTYTFR